MNSYKVSSTHRNTKIFYAVDVERARADERKTKQSSQSSTMPYNLKPINFAVTKISCNKRN